MKTVLLVTGSSEIQSVVWSAADELALEIMLCPGPHGRYLCIGEREGRCPLAADADAIILDAGLMGGGMPEHDAASQLLDYYLRLGKPVLLLARQGELADPGDAPGVTRLPRPLDVEGVVSGVRAAFLPDPQS